MSNQNSLVRGQRSKFRAVLSLVAVGFLVATCATPTLYEPASTNGGYQETKLEENRYRVTFAGNSLTKRQTVEDYLLFRAAELTVENGKDYFIVVEQDTDSKSRYRTTYDDFGWPYYGPHYALGYYRFPYSIYGHGLHRDAYTTVSTRYTASADIVVMSGEKPQDNPTAYDARSIIQNLGASVVRPQPES